VNNRGGRERPTRQLPTPPPTLPTRSGAGGRAEVLDPVRRRWVAFTPEEGVRQRLLRHLLALGYPAGLLAVERPFPYMGQMWRADVVAYDRSHRPLVLAECKAPGVRLGQAVLDQLARYNTVVKAGILVLTNGAEIAVGTPADGVVTPLPAVPPFPNRAEPGGPAWSG